jgi:tetratricopeptide (TPR) repeat protein
VRKFSVPFVLIILATVTSQGQTARSAEDYLDSAVAHARNKQTDEALKDLDKAIELDPHNAMAFLLRGNLRERKKEIGQALSDYNEAIRLAPDARGMEVAYNNRSVIRLSKGDLAGAREDIDNAIRLNPNAAALYNQRAIIRLQEGKPDAAAADYEKALELNPNLPSAYFGLGDYRFQRGDLDGAIEYFNKAIELYPGYFGAYVSRGIARGIKGDVEGAVADLRKGVALNADAISDQSRGNFTSPVKDLTQFITSNPSNARAYELRGLLRLMQGKATESEEDFRKSLEMDAKLRAEIDGIVKEVKASGNNVAVPR